MEQTNKIVLNKATLLELLEKGPNALYDGNELTNFLKQKEEECIILTQLSILVKLYSGDVYNYPILFGVVLGQKMLKDQQEKEKLEEIYSK